MGIYKMLPKTGKHVERDADGVEWEYGPGNTIESDRNLVELFPNKFIRVDTETMPGSDVAQPTIPVPHRFVRDGEIVPPVKTESVKTEPVKIETVKTEAVKTEPGVKETKTKKK